MWRKLFFDLQYRFAKPPWDSNITPPEVVSFIEDNPKRGRALDLGCGTGTNSIFLAQRGFAVVGVDFSPKAIASAGKKASRAGVAVDFHVGDVTRLGFLREPFGFVLDIGCLHAIDAAGRARYAENLARLTRKDSVFMLYTFSPRPENERGHLIRLQNVGITPEAARHLFVPQFSIERVDHGADRGERASAWYWFKRQ